MTIKSRKKLLYISEKYVYNTYIKKWDTQKHFFCRSFKLTLAQQFLFLILKNIYLKRREEINMKKNCRKEGHSCELLNLFIWKLLYLTTIFFLLFSRALVEVDFLLKISISFMFLFAVYRDFINAYREILNTIKTCFYRFNYHICMN